MTDSGNAAKKIVDASSVGDSIDAARANWSFDGKVADTFVEHVSRSVPLYEVGHDLICKMSDFFIYNNSVAYEIGCSTAELLAKLARFNSHKSGSRWIGIDPEAPMIRKAKQHCKGLKNVKLVVDDVNTFEFEPADFIVSYYCIQFIRPCLRQAIFEKIYESLNWGGAFILFEKVRAPDARFQDMATAFYMDFKQQQGGFSDEEVMAKSRSLRGVLEPYSSQANVEYLKRAGFKDIMPIMKYVCFEGWIAIK